MNGHVRRVVIVVAIALGLAGAHCLFGSDEEEEAVEAPEIEEIEATEQEIEEPEPVKWEDVATKINNALSEDWEEYDIRVLYDTSYRLLNQVEKQGKDIDEVVTELAELADSVIQLQPAFGRGREGGRMRALRIAMDLRMAALEYSDMSCNQLGLVVDNPEAEQSVPRSNHYILASMGARESGFLKRTERGYVQRGGKRVENCRWCRGTRGERGMFQFMPKGWIQREFMPTNCNPFDRFCAARGASKALSHLRCLCIKEFGDKCTVDVFVAGYGLTRLPEPTRARGAGGTDRARGYLCSVREDCNNWWPIN